MNDQLIKKILDSEFRDGYRPTDEQSKLIDKFVAQHETDDLCELLYSQMPEGYDPDKMASFFSMLLWYTSDNGTQIAKTLESWAVSEDENKVRISHSDEIEVVLENVKHRIKS
ncbi:MAG: hypothetical protein HY080_08950 [Gammaproteobacteria bacterium]|nr:hypothetical protein [Gammaproteobacteria bacterium]